MKKIKISDILLIIGALLVLLIAFFALGSGEEEETKTSGKSTIDGEAGLVEITYDDYKEKVSANEKFIIVVEKASCGYCQMYLPVLEEVVAEKNIQITYVDLDEFSESDFNELSSTNSYLSSNNWGTPTTLLMSGEEVLDSISGYVEKDKVIEFLEKNELIESE